MAKSFIVPFSLYFYLHELVWNLEGQGDHIFILLGVVRVEFANLPIVDFLYNIIPCTLMLIALDESFKTLFESGIAHLIYKHSQSSL